MFICLCETPPAAISAAIRFIPSYKDIKITKVRRPDKAAASARREVKKALESSSRLKIELTKSMTLKQNVLKAITEASVLLELPTQASCSSSTELLSFPYLPCPLAFPLPIARFLLF